MNLKKYALRIAALSFLILLMGLTGCSGKKAAETVSQPRRQIIAVLGREDYVYADESFINGMNMALEDASSAVSWKHYDDNGDYEQGLMLAQQLARDDQVAAVFSFQDFEVIDAEAEYFETAKKPLFAVQGCYEATLEKGYQYVFSAYMSSKDMGVAMAQYCAGKGLERVVCSHSNTTFELDEMKGFCAQAEEEGISVVDMQLGPDSMNDLEVAYQRWKQLGVDALYICKYTENVEQKEWIFRLIQYIKQQDPEFLVMGDYSLNGASYLERYGDDMEGTTYPNPYPIADHVSSKAFAKEYKNRFPETDDVSEGAYQAYDLTKMVLLSLQNGSDGPDLDIFQSEKGYDGVSGTINYTEDGKIQTPIEYFTVHNGVFVRERLQASDSEQ